MNCEKCKRRRKCNEEDRLYTYYTLDDMQFDPEYEKNGIRASHGMLGIGKECPKEKKKPYLYEDQEEIGYVPPACKHCSNHPSNGGTGICHCVLGNLQITC